MALISRNKTYALFLAALIVCLGLILIYSDQGLQSLHHQSQEKLELQKSNEELAEENRRLMLKIDRIKKDTRFIQEEARKKLGLIRPDETIYRLKDEPEELETGERGREFKE